jgi:hypothetical protein
MPETSESNAPTYYEGTWSGKPHYVCLLCGTSSLNFDKLTEHLRAFHACEPLSAPSQAVASAQVESAVPSSPPRSPQTTRKATPAARSGHTQED